MPIILFKITISPKIFSFENFCKNFRKNHITFFLNMDYKLISTEDRAIIHCQMESSIALDIIQMQNEYEFIISDFFKLDDDFEKILYILNHLKKTQFDSLIAKKILYQIINFDFKQELLLFALNKFLNAHETQKNIQFLDIALYLANNFELNKLLLNSISLLMNVSEKSFYDDSFFERIFDTNLLIISEEFWIFCLKFRNYESKENSNILFERGIINFAKQVLSEYDKHNISLKVIELVFRVILNIIDDKNITIFMYFYHDISESVHYFKTILIEPFLFALLMDENAITNEEILIDN